MKNQIDGRDLKRMFQYGSNLLNQNKEVVDSLNVFPVPDGDTGTNMSLTMESAINQIASLKKITIETVSQAVSNGSLMGARGNSGVILSQIFRGFEKGCRGKELLTVKDFAMSLKEASNTAYKAVMKPTEGTILTVIRETSERGLILSDSITDFDEFLKEMIKHAEFILEKTPEQLDVLKQAGVVDAGGKGLVYILKGFLIGLNENIDLEELDNTPETISIKHRDYEKFEDITFGYCTEFIIKGENLEPEKFKKEIMDLGDSLLVVGDEDLIKVHIHTNNPGKAIESGLKIGELIDIKIDNMRFQHKNRIVMEEQTEEFKEYGFISVAMGDGLCNIFNDLNVDKIISGGQTMNPSTEDLLKAVDEIKAKNIFILPNNSNIILTANQVKNLTDKTDKNIWVIPTKTIPQGISALLEFDPSNDAEKNYNKMTEIIQCVKTIQITYSVRDSKYNGLDIKKDDIIGICDGEIISVGNDIEEVTLKTLDNVLNDDSEILTMYYGHDISDDMAEKFGNTLKSKFKEMDVEIYYGGQPLYYYIFSVE